MRAFAETDGLNKIFHIFDHRHGTAKHYAIFLRIKKLQIQGVKQNLIANERRNAAPIAAFFARGRGKMRKPVLGKLAH